MNTHARSNLLTALGFLTAAFVLVGGCTSAAGGTLSATIDREIKAGWSKEKITPPGRSSDAVFLRRIYIDLVGMIPGYEETTTFLADTDPEKRAKLIDRLLVDPRY